MLSVLVAVIGGLIGLAGILWQKRAERYDTARRHREALYGRLLHAILVMKASGDIAPFYVETQAAWLYASDDVLKHIGEYLQEIKRQWDQQELDPATIQTVEAGLIASIRKDLRTTVADESWITDRWPVDVVPSADAIARYLSGEFSGNTPEDDDSNSKPVDRP